MSLSPFALAECGWAVLMIVWFIGFFGNKRTAKIEHWGEQAVVFLLFFVSGSLLFSPTAATLASHGSAWNWIGVFLVYVSVAFAIWARVTLGKNWSGAVVTLKKDHKLVTGGPYGVVRHPIYTGFLGAGIGTALVVGTMSGWLGVVAMLVAILIRIRREEALMTAQFPDAYPEYKRRTKALVPFIV